MRNTGSSNRGFGCHAGSSETCTSSQAHQSRAACSRTAASGDASSRAYAAARLPSRSASGTPDAEPFPRLGPDPAHVAGDPLDLARRRRAHREQHHRRHPVRVRLRVGEPERRPPGGAEDQPAVDAQVLADPSPCRRRARRSCCRTGRSWGRRPTACCCRSCAGGSPRSGRRPGRAAGACRGSGRQDRRARRPPAGRRVAADLPVHGVAVADVEQAGVQREASAGRARARPDPAPGLCGGTTSRQTARRGRPGHRRNRSSRSAARRPPAGRGAHGQADVAARHRTRRGARATSPPDWTWATPRPARRSSSTRPATRAATRGRSTSPAPGGWCRPSTATGCSTWSTSRSSGVDRVPFSYYRAKFAAEQVLLASGLPVTLLRVTQFHDFVDTLLETARRGPVLPVPMGWRLQPVDVDEVAAHIGVVAAAPPTGGVLEFGGPEELTAADVARAWAAARGSGRPRGRHSGAREDGIGDPGRRGAADRRCPGHPHVRPAPAGLSAGRPRRSCQISQQDGRRDRRVRKPPGIVGPAT